MVSWNQLADGLKRANWDFADGAWGLVQQLGADIVPAPIGPIAGLQFADYELERLAELEHERWRRSREAEGYVPGAPRNDNPANGPLTHPSLIPYQDLSESEKDKDRESIRDIGVILAQAGLAVSDGWASSDADWTVQ